ncbi:MAG: hypothetical protein E7641_03790 [Ruminococcaceae bacterium]|nr:hypothetical protein [Oscillospiraceae bacterium]
MATINIDLTKAVKKMKPMHAMGQPPLGGRRAEIFGNFKYLQDFGAPYSRLHDVGGVYGANRYVDVPNIFRDFDADENDPASYDFEFTDRLITALVKAGIEPYYRLGVTIENQSAIKAYRIFPPKDYEKWARICEHIIAHYTEGWADGFNYDITYWEIWNEPDDGFRGEGYVSQMWIGTKEEYFRLYDVTAKHLKARFPNIKVGGYASCGFNAILGDEKELAEKPHYLYQLEFFHCFMKYIKEHSSPIDFFSYHSYSKVDKIVKYDEWLHNALVEYGYGDIEVHLNEWNPAHTSRGTGLHAAEVTAVMLAMQCGYTDMLMFYDSRLMGTSYAGLFDPLTCKPFHGYYAMVAFNTLYSLGEQVALECDTEGLYAVAASDGDRHALLISNVSGERVDLDILGVDLSGARWHVIDDKRLLSWSPAVKKIENNSVVLVEF